MTTEDALTALESFRLLEPGWDSYGGDRISSSAIDLAIRLVQLIGGQPVPCSDGSVSIEWHKGDDEFALNIPPEPDPMGAYLAVEGSDYEALFIHAAPAYTAKP